MEQISTIPVAALRESPFNPRKSYPEGSLLDLAESISSQGIMQPIVARPIPEKQQDIQHRFEIVFGHRRFRAASSIGLDAVPVIVRAMTDAEAAVAQVHENLQRVDVSPMEEADSLARLQSEHKMKPDAIAEAIGKSTSFVYGRLKLARMAPEVRAAVVDQALPPDIALELARIPDHNLQRATLKSLKQYDGSWPSVRHAKSHMASVWSRKVSAAPFDPDDAKLAARAGACKGCPRRAGNDPDLRAAMDADVCTDEACWNVKTEATRTIRITQLRADGHRVIDAAEAKDYLPQRWSEPRGFTPLEHPAFDNDSDDDDDVGETTFAKAIEQLGDKAPKLTVIRNPHTGELQEYITDEQAKAVLEALGKGNAGDPGGDDDARAARAGGYRSTAAERRGHGIDTSSWSKGERVIMDHDARYRMRKAVLERLATVPRSVDELRAMLLREHDLSGNFGLVGEVYGLEVECQQAEARCEASGGDFIESLWYQERIRAMGPDELGRLLAALAIDEALTGSIYPRDDNAREHAAALVAIAARYGVDAADFAGEEEPTGNASEGQADAFQGSPA